MDLKNRIEKIGDYFKSCNIAEGVIYALVNFPNQWIVPDKDTMKEMYGVEVTKDSTPNCFYFFTTINNGTDAVFDAVEYTVTINKAIEEKSKLFEKALNDLKEMFTNEDDINVLKTLTMSFKSKKAKKKSVKQPKEEDKKTVDKTPSKTDEMPQISPVTNDKVKNDKLPSIEEEDAAEGKNRVLNEVLDLIDNKEI